MEEIEKYINKLMKKNNVTIEMVNEYEKNKNNRRKISGIRKIFDMRTKKDALLCLTVIKILGAKDAEILLDQYVKDTDISEQIGNDFTDFFEKNKTFIFSALLNNSRFLAMSMNLVGLINYRLGKRYCDKKPIEQ